MPNVSSSPPLRKPLQEYIDTLTEEFGQIPEQRKEVLQKLASVIRQKVQAKEPVKVIFICTHNSRRSHLSQIWAQTAAYYYGVGGIETYSGGTEATAFNPRAVKAMQKAGFSIQKTGEETNPTYLVAFAEAVPPLRAFSKVYDATVNPKDNFIAVMTCSHADENCPFIPGASLRMPVNYDDPKDFDGTPQEEAQYDQRTRQIASEMFYLVSRI